MKICFGEEQNNVTALAAGGDGGQVIPQEESKLQARNGLRNEGNDWMKRRRRRGQHLTLGYGSGTGAERCAGMTKE